MSGNLLLIGQSGAMAARAALELTGQNIANVGNADYARRSLALADLTPTGTVAYTQGFTAGSGVRIDRVVRSDATILFAQARQSGSDLTRATAELAGLQEAERSVEQAGIYPALVEFEAALGALRSDPLSPSLRSAVIERGQVLADSVRLGDSGLAGAAGRVTAEAQAGVVSLNRDAGELVRVNEALLRAREGTSGHAALLDQRDALLGRMAQTAGIAVEYGQRGVVNVRLGDASGPFLVNGTTAPVPLSLQPQPDGTAAFTLGGAAVAISSGALAGHGQALTELRDARSALDAMAVQLVTTVNGAQASGVTPAGVAGPPMFAGSSARDLALVLRDPAGLATAPAGAGAQSRSTANLDALRAALANGGPTAAADALLSRLSQAVAGRTVAREVLATVADSARAALSRETAVDLDAEAADLLRFQQAFQASGRVIQAAAEIFDTILGIR